MSGRFAGTCRASPAGCPWDDRTRGAFPQAHAALALMRLARHHEVTQRQMLERLIITADDKITVKLGPTSDAWEGYFDVTQARRAERYA
jgi:hypothetical protein